MNNKKKDNQSTSYEPFAAFDCGFVLPEIQESYKPSFQG